MPLAAPTSFLPRGEITTLDDFFTLLDIGPWTWLYFLAAALSPVAEVINLMGIEFMAPPMNFTCADRHVDDTEGRVPGNECYISPDGTGPLCTRFKYDDTVFLSTVTSDYDLVCSRASSLKWYQVIFTAGCILGSPMGGIFSDRYGRQPAIWYGTVFTLLFTIANLVSSNFQILLIIRLLLGISTTFVISPAYTIGIEVCPMKYRSIYGVSVALPYAFTLVILAGISYMKRTWLSLQAFALLPLCFLLLITNSWVLKESPRWLVARGRLREAEHVLKQAAYLNRRRHYFPKNIRHTLKKILLKQGGQEDEKPLYFWDRLSMLYSSPIMRKITLIILTVWLFQSCLYISIPLRAHVFKSPFNYMAALGIAEIPAYTITAPITTKFGRKKVVIICLAFTAVLELLLALFEGLHYRNDKVTCFISAIAYTFVCSFYQVNVMYSTELFPTSVRTLGTSLSYFMSSTGWNLPPILEYMMPPDEPWICLVLYSSMAFVAVVLITLLPETNKMPLMQTVREFETFVSNRSAQSSLNTLEMNSLNKSNLMTNCLLENDICLNNYSDDHEINTLSMKSELLL